MKRKSFPPISSQKSCYRWQIILEILRGIARGKCLEGGEVLLCKIRNVLAEELLCDETLSLEKRMETIRPVHSIRQSYFRWDGTEFGPWGEPMQRVLNDLKGR